MPLACSQGGGAEHMNKTLSIVLALLLAGFVMYAFRQARRDARNGQSIKRLYSGDRPSGGGYKNVPLRPSTDGVGQGGRIRLR